MLLEMKYSRGGVESFYILVGVRGTSARGMLMVLLLFFSVYMSPCTTLKKRARVA